MADNGLKKDNTFCITLSGIMSAAAFLFCFLAGLSPVAGLSLLAIASFFIGIIIAETNIKYAVLAYVSTSLLVLLFVSQKMMVIPAVLFFLLYPIVKKLVEKEGFLFTSIGGRKTVALKWMAKLIFFVASFVISYILLVNFFGIDYITSLSNRLAEFNIHFSTNTTYAVLGLTVIVVFVIYDILFSQLGRIYLFKYSRYLRRNKQ